jgi:hypothetical protein
MALEEKIPDEITQALNVLNSPVDKENFQTDQANRLAAGDLLGRWSVGSNLILNFRRKTYIEEQLGISVHFTSPLIGAEPDFIVPGRVSRTAEIGPTARGTGLPGQEKTPKLY